MIRRLSYFVFLALAAALLLSMISPYLPANGDLSKAIGWLGIDGRSEVQSPIWGELVRWSVAHLPGSYAFRLGFVSAFGGVLSIAFLILAVDRFLRVAARKAEEKAIVGERTYDLPVRLGASFAALALLVSPPFFLAATRTGPLTVQLAIPLAAFALLGVMTTVRHGLVLAYFAVVVGFLAALGLFEGAPGLVAFPFLFVLCLREVVRRSHRIATMAGLFLVGALGGGAFAMGDEISVRYIVRSLSALVKTLPGGLIFPGIVPLVVFVVLPMGIVATFIATRRLTSASVRKVIFGVWAFVLVVMTAVTCASHPIDLGCAADRYVDRALARLGTAKWIVSDGTWDDFMLLKKPEGTRLVTFRRENDPEYGRELLAWVKADLSADDDLRFAAELGPSKFLSEWFARDKSAATNCLFVTRLERGAGDVRLVPAVYGWQSEQAAADVTAEALAKEWTSAWEAFAPYLERRGEPAADMLRRWFSVQGNSIGAMAAAGDQNALAWKTCYRVVDGVYTKNMSAYLNLGALLDRGYKPPTSEEQFVRNQLKVRLNSMRNLEEARWELASGGRLFVDPKIREQIAKMREAERKAFETSSARQLLVTAADEMRHLGELKGEERQKELSRMEATTIVSLRSAQVAPWMKNLLLGDFALQRGSRESLEMARTHFRYVIMDGTGEYKMAFARLLNLDWALKDKEGLEYDALLILRKDVRHQQANAFLGMLRLENGDCASAERFLRRALREEGGPQATVKNDLALALSGLGRHEEAEKIMREALAEMPQNWNFHDSLAQILRAAGKREEADAAQWKARDLAREQNEMEPYRAVRSRRR